MRERLNPLFTIQKLVQKLYSSAKAVFWAGSVSSGYGTETSDLDLVVVFDCVPNAYREAFIYDGWPIDAFIHDVSTLDYFYHSVDLPSFIPALPSMIAHGILITKDSELSLQLQKQALDLLREKPKIDHTALLNRRFHITDELDDLKVTKTPHEFMAIKCSLYQHLAEFYLLANGRWIGSGKQLPRLLEAMDVTIAEDFYLTFSKDNIHAIEKFVEKILTPYGGLLWDGFKLNAPKEWRKHKEVKSALNKADILTELKRREPIFHHPDKFGTTRQNILDITCDEFWEVGASGNVYTREYVIQVLLERYSDAEYKDIWETKDFDVLEITPNNYLLTYVLLQGERITRRATIWRYTENNWKILYHQGTIIQEPQWERK